MRLEGDAEQTSPDDGVIDTVRLTVPWNPLIRVAVIVEFPRDPARSAIDVGLAVIEKSSTRVLAIRVDQHGPVWACGRHSPVMLP